MIRAFDCGIEGCGFKPSSDHQLKNSLSTKQQLASVALLDAHPTGDQEVGGSTPAWSATFLCGDFIMKYFLRSVTPFC